MVVEFPGKRARLRVIKLVRESIIPSYGPRQLIHHNNLAYNLATDAKG